MNERYLSQGKRIDNGEWTCGYCRKVNENHVINSIDSGSIGYDYKVNPETLRQCTGLKDKNRKLIFEGDIYQVKVKRTNIVETYTYVIKWNGYGYMVDGISDLDDRNNDSGFLMNTYKIEIIGNIHDNPELLEVTS